MLTYVCRLEEQPVFLSLAHRTYVTPHGEQCFITDAVNEDGDQVDLADPEQWEDVAVIVVQHPLQPDTMPQFAVVELDEVFAEAYDAGEVVIYGDGLETLH